MTYLEENKFQMVNNLSQFIKIPSVSNDSQQVDRALSYVIDLASSLGMKASKELNGQIGIIQVGDGDETLGILAHVDVVDVGDLSKWENEPFGGEITKGKIIGRGALDDKGPIIACLYALKSAMENGKCFTKKVQIVLGTQEETEWTDMEAYVKAFKLPDYGFTPDGSFPISNIEKGCYDIVMKFPLENKTSWVADDKDICNKEKKLRIERLFAGTATNVVPGTCKAILSDGREVNAFGKAVHSSIPEKGENAIFVMADMLKELNISNNMIFKVLRKVREAFEDFYGDKMNIAPKNEYYKGEFIHKNVFTPTIIKTEGQWMEVAVNVRFTHTTTEEELTNAFKDFCTELGGHITELNVLPPVYVSKDSPFLEKLAEAYEEVTPFKNSFNLGYGGSYSKVMPNIVSWGPILPGMEDTCHEENESIKIKDLETCAKIYYKAIEKIAQTS